MEETGSFDHLLSIQERKLREILLAYPNRLCDFEFLAEYIGSHSPHPRKLLRVVVCRVRETLDKGDIIAVQGRGYMFAPAAEPMERIAS